MVFQAWWSWLFDFSAGREEHLWSWLNCRLSDYRQAGEFTAMPRTLAERFLRDIPRRYGVKQIHE